MLPEADEGPITKLVYAILLSALNKRATDIAVRRVGGVSRVDFVVDGSETEEMRPPSPLHERIVRKLAVLGALPVYAKGQYAAGTIKLRIGKTREAEFGLRVEGHGETLAAYLRVLSDSRSDGAA